MKRKTLVVVAAVVLVLSVSLTSFAAGMAAEKAMHPRIAKAIHTLEDAIDYMQKAPHDFGGHRADAVEASKHAVEQLRLALAYRGGSDHK